MAYLSPSIITSGTPNSEQNVFKLFQNSKNTDDWIVLHSLNLPKRSNSWMREIDFVVLAPNRGIFIIEVKSLFKIEGGTWHFKDGDNWRAGKSAVTQVRDNFMKLSRELKNLFPNNFLYINYGIVIRENIWDNSTNKEEDSKRFWDKNYSKNPIEEFITQLEKHDPAGDRKIIDKNDAEKIKTRFRQDLDVPLSLNQDDEVLQAIENFTQEQLEVLDSFEKSPRLIVNGSSGTGKTVMAAEIAKRRYENDKHILFITPFKRLNGQVSNKLGLQNLYDKIKVMTFEKLISDMVGNYYSPTMDNKYETAIVNNNVTIKYNTVIVDEWQVLSKQECMDIMDAVLSGGLKKGRCYLFGDPKYQLIFSRQDQLTKTEKILSKYGFAYAPELKTNCRNTKEIGKAFSILSKADIPEKYLSRVKGNSPTFIFYESLQDHKEKLWSLLKLITKVKNFDDANNTTIIGPPNSKVIQFLCSDANYLSEERIAKERFIIDFKPNRTGIMVISRKDETGKVIWDFPGLSKDYVRYNYFSITQYQGCENSRIILIEQGSQASIKEKSIVKVFEDNERAEEEDFQMSQKKLKEYNLYVGLSRAQAGLIVFFHKEHKADINNMDLRYLDWTNKLKLNN